jgi:hypothetical protein
MSTWSRSVAVRPASNSRSRLRGLRGAGGERELVGECLEVLSDVIQPFPDFSTIFDSALRALRVEIVKMPPPFAARACADGAAKTVRNDRR